METPPANQPLHRRFRWVLPALVVVLLSQFSVAKDSFAELSRPLVLGIIRLFGGQAADLGHAIHVGRLEVPWSGDCAGMNLLVLLLALAIWMNRDQPMGGSYWLRLALMIPAALVANVLRVFMILGYRELFFPKVESPQLHYFFGLILLAPLSLLAMPKSPRAFSHRVFELLHVAAVVALLAPHADGVNGAALVIAVILGLSRCRLVEKITLKRGGAFILWLIAAAGIAVSGMESFWLPWLLVCPLLADSKWFFSLPGALVTLASHPLFTIAPGGDWLIWLIIAFAIWKSSPHLAPVAEPGARQPAKATGWLALATAALLLPLPFLSSLIIAGQKEIWTPPADCVTEDVPGGLLVTLPGQSPAIGTLWYDSEGVERHHKLAICLKYRGITLVPTDTPEVFTDGKHWMREYYLQADKLHQNHLQYVLSTLGPGNGGGVHLILVSEQKSMTAEEFSRQAAVISQDLFTRIQEEKRTTQPQ